MKRKRFMLVGNGSCLNRGCQAITCGTHRLFSDICPGATFVSASFGLDAPTDLPDEMESILLPLYPARWSLKGVKSRIQKRLGLHVSREDVLTPLRTSLPGCDILLSVGGDNYAIDYGYEIVERLIVIGNYARSIGIPQVIWGASIGPFDKDSAFESRMVNFLADVDLIVVRETHSLRYLNKLGLTQQVVLAPDPSYLMKPKPCALPGHIAAMLRSDVIGVNLSMLMARHVANNSLVQWTLIASELIQRLSDSLDLPVLLIPHVFCAPGETWIDDERFLRAVLEKLPTRLHGRVWLLPGRPSAPELKWIIAQTTIFVGARTHSTIAALSSGVPCLSLAYSRKSHGLNEWVFGHGDWSVDASLLTPQLVAEKATRLYGERDVVRSHLARQSVNTARDLTTIGLRIIGLDKGTGS